MALIVGAVLAIIAVVIAMLEANMDFQAIRRNEPINHRREMVERIRMVGSVMLIAYIGYGWASGNVWCVIPFTGVAWASFTMSFRFALNYMRGLHPAYMSRSNDYDSLFIGLQRPTDGYIERAGMMAYSVEGAVLMASFVSLYFWGA